MHILTVAAWARSLAVMTGLDSDEAAAAVSQPNRDLVGHLRYLASAARQKVTR